MKGYKLSVLSVVLFFALYAIPYTLYPVSAANSLDAINQKVCNRFEEDISKLAAIMEEVRDRNGIQETRVAFGGIDTPVKSADYQITFVAEAIAYQRAQKYQSKAQLRNSLEGLKNKILKAKSDVKKAINAQ